MKILRVPLLTEDSVWKCTEMRENRIKQKQMKKTHLPRGLSAVPLTAHLYCLAITPRSQIKTSVSP